MLKYEIARASSAAELEQAVQDKLREGWELQGGVSVAMTFESWNNERKGYGETLTSTIFAQAMVIHAGADHA
jgi:hypothetical protein